MTGINIQTYTDVYQESVTDLILNIQNSEFGIPITLELQPDLNEIPAFYQVNKGNFWVATIGNEVIGTISLLDIGNNQGVLRKMFVNKKYRGKELGIGYKLLNTLLTWARDQNIEEIFLGTTDRFSGAQKFYEKNGFTGIEKQELPENFPVMEVDTRFYRFQVTFLS